MSDKKIIAVVYESFFGNTQTIASQIVDVLNTHHDVTLIPIENAPEILNEKYEYVIMGTPTRAFRPSEKTLAFMKSLKKNDLSGKKCAVFDTRVALEDIPKGIIRFMAKKFGYAAEKLHSMIEKKGGELVSEYEGFYVKDSEGPLAEGELERASSWAEKIIS